MVPDLAERLPGRGVWVTAGRPEVSRAAATGLFARAGPCPGNRPVRPRRQGGGRTARTGDHDHRTLPPGRACHGRAREGGGGRSRPGQWRCVSRPTTGPPDRGAGSTGWTRPSRSSPCSRAASSGWRSNATGSCTWPVTRGSAGSGGLVARLRHDAGRLAAYRGIPNEVGPGKRAVTGSKGSSAPPWCGGKRARAAACLPGQIRRSASKTGAAARGERGRRPPP